MPKEDSFVKEAEFCGTDIGVNGDSSVRQVVYEMPDGSYEIAVVLDETSTITPRQLEYINTKLALFLIGVELEDA
jgi:hypothetical protein